MLLLSLDVATAPLRHTISHIGLGHSQIPSNHWGILGANLWHRYQLITTSFHKRFKWILICSPIATTPLHVYVSATEGIIRQFHSYHPRNCGYLLIYFSPILPHTFTTANRHLYRLSIPTVSGLVGRSPPEFTQSEAQSDINCTVSSWWWRLSSSSVPGRPRKPTSVGPKYCYLCLLYFHL